jgi:hypothetical protein
VHFGWLLLPCCLCPLQAHKAALDELQQQLDASYEELSDMQFQADQAKAAAAAELAAVQEQLQVGQGGTHGRPECGCMAAWCNIDPQPPCVRMREGKGACLHNAHGSTKFPEHMTCMCLHYLS